MVKMIEIKVSDGYNYESRIENNNQHLYATLKALGDIVIERFECVEYDEDTIEQEFLEEAMLDVSSVLSILDDEVKEKTFKYFYKGTPEIIGNKYIYRQRKSRMKELAKLAMSNNISRV